jgi:hypothetical protein
MPALALMQKHFKTKHFKSPAFLLLGAIPKKSRLRSSRETIWLKNHDDFSVIEVRLLNFLRIHAKQIGLNVAKICFKAQRNCYFPAQPKGYSHILWGLGIRKVSIWLSTHSA